MKLRTRNVGENKDVSKIIKPSSKKQKKTLSVSSNKSSYSSDCLISVLPLALVLEIFFKLPINAILNCKSVCKSWFNILVSDPHFSKNYYPPSTTFLITPNLPRDYIYNPVTDQVFCLLELDRDPTTTFRTYGKPLTLPCGWSSESSRTKCNISVVGASNGFVCVSLSKASFKTVYVCNPFSNETIKMLPKYKVDVRNFQWVDYAFGFCPSVNRFKVVRIVFFIDKTVQCDIFTVGVDKRWRRCCSEAFVDNIYCAPIHKLGVLVPYGAFHWLVDHRGKDGTIFIRTFDLNVEEIGHTIPPPPSVRLERDISTKKVHLLSNRLCLLDYAHRREIHIWTLNDQYGGRGSIHEAESAWTKDVVVMTCFPIDWFPTENRMLFFLPLRKLQNGDVLLSHPSLDFFISYNIKDRKCRRIQAPATQNRRVMAFISACFASSGEVGMRGDSFVVSS